MVLLQSKSLEPGWEAPGFELLGTDNKNHNLSEFTDKKGLLIIFTCNHCPYAQAAWPLLVDLHEAYNQDIDFVAINPNDSSHYPEDSFEAMQQLKTDQNILFPYLQDETQEVAEDYQAQCTPDIYLFKNEGKTPKLYYHGRINDNWQHPELVQENSLEDSIIGLLDDQIAPVNQPPSMGCSIKWKGQD